MLSKVLGIVMAGVFIGAAAVEILGYRARLLAGKIHGRNTPPTAADPETDATELQDENAPRSED
jgi:hypothetical protein